MVFFFKQINCIGFSYGPTADLKTQVLMLYEFYRKTESKWTFLRASAEHAETSVWNH